METAQIFALVSDLLPQKNLPSKIGQNGKVDLGNNSSPGGSGKPEKVSIHQGNQDKHIEGTSNQKHDLANGKTRSLLTVDAQELLDQFSGNGEFIIDKSGNKTNRERINCGKVIGQYYDIKTGQYLDTTRATIHYDNKGKAHIVPANPVGD